MPLADPIQTIYPSPLVLVILFVILGACLAVFVTLVRRETRHRRTVALSQWARNRSLHIADPETEVPELAPLNQFKPKVQAAIRGDNITLVQIETPEIPLAAGAVSAKRWNLIFRKLEATWRTTALRPAEHSVSAVDLFSLSSYPSLMQSTRFMIFGAESRAAQFLAESSAPALLPADVGLILYGTHLILDFSGRPFDEIEFDRLIDLTKQLAPRLSPGG
jgi:hypothetical protein